MSKAEWAEAGVLQVVIHDVHLLGAGGGEGGVGNFPRPKIFISGALPVRLSGLLDQLSTARHP